MEDWIFQANLKRYDVHAEVTQSRTWWNTPHHRAEIAINNRVWLQIAGPYTPGLHYVATVASPVYERTEIDDPESPMFGRWRTDIRFHHRIHPPLSREELLNDPTSGRSGLSAAFKGQTHRCHPLLPRGCWNSPPQGWCPSRRRVTCRVETLKNRGHRRYGFPYANDTLTTIVQYESGHSKR